MSSNSSCQLRSSLMRHLRVSELAVQVVEVALLLAFLIVAKAPDPAPAGRALGREQHALGALVLEIRAVCFSHATSSLTSWAASASLFMPARHASTTCAMSCISWTVTASLTGTELCGLRI